MAVEISFMTKSPRKNVADVGIELGAACMPSELASDRATAPGGPEVVKIVTLYRCTGRRFTVATRRNGSCCDQSHCYGSDDDSLRMI